MEMTAEIEGPGCGREEDIWRDIGIYAEKDFGETWADGVTYLYSHRKRRRGDRLSLRVLLLETTRDSVRYCFLSTCWCEMEWMAFVLLCRN